MENLFYTLETCRALASSMEKVCSSSGYMSSDYSPSSDHSSSFLHFTSNWIEMLPLEMISAQLALTPLPNLGCASDDPQKTMDQSFERLELTLKEIYLERGFKNASEAWQTLATCTRASRQKLSRLWSSTTKLNQDRAHCRSRNFSRRCLYLKQYIELVLDFDAPDSHLEAGGRLDRTLHNAERFLQKSNHLGSKEVHYSDLMVLSRTLDFVAEYREAQSRLEQLYAYEELLEAEYQTVQSQLQQLRSVEDALDEEQRRKEEEQRQFEIYMERFERSIRAVTTRLQIFIGLLLILCKFSGLPDSEQPRCMTMPWNIRPALIVLWGVCWMFYPHQEGVNPKELSARTVHGNGQNAPIEWPQLMDDHTDIRWNPEWEQQLNSLLGINANAQQPSISASGDMLDFSNFLVTSPPSTFPDGGAYISNPGNSYTPLGQSTTIDSGIMKEKVPQNCDLGDASGSQDILHSPFRTVNRRALPPMHSLSGYGLASNHRESNPVFLESSSLTPRAPGTPTIQATPPIPTWQPSTVLDQPQAAPQNAEGVIMCKHPQCSDLQFNQLSDLKKHNDRIHNRHTCNLPGCTQSFGSKGELSRHKQTKHKQLPPHKLLRCPEQGCKYSQTAHFKRKDNLTDHLKRMHSHRQADSKVRADAQARAQASDHYFASQAVPQPRISAAPVVPAPASASISPPPPPTTTTNSPSQKNSSSSPPDTLMPSPSKRRRLHSPPPIPVEPLPSTTVPLPSIDTPNSSTETETATWKLKAATFEAKAQAMQAENISLQKENEALKSEIERLKKNEDSLIAVLAGRKV